MAKNPLNVCYRDHVKFGKLVCACYDPENRVELIVDSKSVRDILCHRLKQAPLRKTADIDVDIKACLTLHQRNNRNYIMSSYKELVTAGDLKFSYSADKLEAWHRSLNFPFVFNLELSNN